MYLPGNLGLKRKRVSASSEKPGKKNKKHVDDEVIPSAEKEAVDDDDDDDEAEDNVPLFQLFSIKESGKKKPSGGKGGKGKAAAK